MVPVTYRTCLKCAHPRGNEEFGKNGSDRWRRIGRPLWVESHLFPKGNKSPVGGNPMRAKWSKQLGQFDR